jgi:lysophospholipase L1-like esterase/pimeloyl-ACP methyl ester carboxylesterase
MRRLFILLLLSLTAGTIISHAQTTQWDDINKKHWPSEFKMVEIPSSTDSSLQKAWMYKSGSQQKQPLIVSLHTWSGDYNQEDPLAKEVLLRDWNYIHPDFRGPNNTPEAGVSSLVISDIQDAIRYCIQNALVDSNEVHIVGVSGGGYATLAAYMKLDFPVKSFNAWAPISNLEAWYWESVGRKQKYARDIEKITSGGNYFDAREAQKRSPVFMSYDSLKRAGSYLNIYAGIHDGYTGSVPISHSINFFNRILSQIAPNEPENLVSDNLHLSLLAKRYNPDVKKKENLGNRKIHLRRNVSGVSLNIFEGGHEMIVPQALSLIPVYDHINLTDSNILTIGDSNGAVGHGWPHQLAKLLPMSTVINKSIPGNTIGFDNLNREQLNTLKNIDNILTSTIDSLNNTAPDLIVIGLGTNDAKTVFKNRQNEVASNMSLLMEKIHSGFTSRDLPVPSVIILSAPPMDERKANLRKYGGGDQRIKQNNKLFKHIAQKYDCTFIDTYSVLKPQIKSATHDGVHLMAKAQFEIANQVLNSLKK